MLRTILTAFLLVHSSAFAFGQTAKDVSELQMPSGGQFAITKIVVAGGGNSMTNNSTAVSGTAGQTSAGVTSTGGQFSLYSGFWTPESFAPTAATATVGGRVFTADNRPIRNVLVTITLPGGQTQTVATGAFGYYRFAEIPVGETYVFSVSSKRFSFEQNAHVRTIIGDTQDINFTAEPAAATLKNENQ